MEPSRASPYIPRTLEAMETPRLESPSNVPPSALKIVPEEYVDTPSSSATASPAESCGSDVVKQCKSWERTVSFASSFHSSVASEAQWGDDVEDAEDKEDDEEPEGSFIVANISKTAVQSLQMQTLVRSMQQRLQGLQRLVQEAAPQVERRLRFQNLNHETEVMERDGFAPAPLKSIGEPLRSDARGSGKMLICEAAGDTNGQKMGISSSSEDGGPLSMITMLAHVKALEEQLEYAKVENQHLQDKVRRLEVENARLQAQAAFNPAEDTLLQCGGDSGAMESKPDQTSNANESTLSVDEGISRLTSATFGEPSAFQMVMKEDLAVLKNHERCQHKLHELWDTIRTLRTLVETFEIERDTMKTQRDEAIADAERADAENAKLACISNPQRKIKYLEQVKKDNQELRRKNRTLNVRLAKQAAKLVCEKNGYSVLEGKGDEASRDTLDPAMLEDSLREESDEPCCKRTSEEILRRTALEQRLERLRLARQELPDDSDNSDSSSDELEAPLVATTSTR